MMTMIGLSREPKMFFNICAAQQQQRRRRWQLDSHKDIQLYTCTRPRMGVEMYFWWYVLANGPITCVLERLLIHSNIHHLRKCFANRKIVSELTPSRPKHIAF